MKRKRKELAGDLLQLALLAQTKKGKVLEYLARRPAEEKQHLIAAAKRWADHNTEDAAVLGGLVKLILESDACDALAKQARDREEAPKNFEASKPEPMEIIGTVYVGNVRSYHVMRSTKSKKPSLYGQTWATPRKRRK